MLKTYLVNPANNKSINVPKDVFGNSAIEVQSPKEAYGIFTSATRSTAGSTTIVSVVGNGAVALTDLILNTQKVNSGIVTVRFNDGTRSVNVISVNTTDIPVNIAIPFSGNWIGWGGAYIELVVAENVVTNVSIGYYRIPQSMSLPYDEWAALR